MQDDVTDRSGRRPAMGAYSCECHRAPRQGTAHEEQARQPLPVHYHPGGQGEVHHGAGGQGRRAPVERGMLLRAAARHPGGRRAQLVPPWQRGPGAHRHAPRTYRTGRVPGTDHHPPG